MSLPFRSRRLAGPYFVVALALSLLAAADRPAATPGPARLRDAPLPLLTVAPNVGGGQVVLVLTVTDSGRVADVLTVRATPPYTDLLRGVVQGWEFAPARDDTGGALASQVLVVGAFRPPTTAGPAPGEPPRDVAPTPAHVPFPSASVLPGYPPHAVGNGTALVEAGVAPDGRATVRLLAASAPAFGEAALAAARRWQFRAGRQSAWAYLVFGFREPVTAGPPPSR